MNFVACPVVRDTKTVPCFLAEYQGETYFLGIQQDITAEFYPPQLLHEVLVEGTVVAGPRVCGGIPLKPLHVSVLPELNRACNTILPAEPGIDAPPAKRPAGPSTRQAPVSTAAVPPKKPEPPFCRARVRDSISTSTATFYSPAIRGNLPISPSMPAFPRRKHIEVSRLPRLDAAFQRRFVD